MPEVARAVVSAPPPGRMRACAARLGLLSTHVIAGGAIGATALGLAGDWWWAFDLFAGFRAQYAVLLAVAAVGYALARRWRLLALVGAFLAFQALSVGGLYLGAHPAAAGPTVSLVGFNANFGNRQVDAVADYLARADADVIAVVEATPLLREALTRRLVGYTITGDARPGADGVLIASRLPVVRQHVLHFGGSPFAAAEAVVALGARELAILVVHPPPPIGGALAAQHRAIVDGIADWARASSPAIVAGDLNATPWSAPLRRLRAEAGLLSSQDGHGYQASWPTDFWPLGIPIDHVLHDPSLVTVSRRVGTAPGSDHRAVHVVLGCRLADCQSVSR